MSRMPYPPPITDGLAAVFDAEDHFTRMGANIADRVWNLVDSVQTNFSTYLIPPDVDPDSGLHYFKTHGGMTLQTAFFSIYGPHRSLEPLNTIGFKYTEILFMRTTTSSGSSYSQSSGVFVGPDDTYFIGGIRKHVLEYWQDFGAGANPYVSAHMIIPYDPWTMYTIMRSADYADTFSTIVQQDDGVPRPIYALTNELPPGLEGTLYSSPDNCYAMLRYNRVLSQEELKTIYDWSLTWLPEHIRAKASAMPISSYTNIVDWDPALGPADIRILGRGDPYPTFPNVQPPFLDSLSTAAAAEALSIYDISWPNSEGIYTEETVLPRTLSPVPLGINVSENYSTRVSFSIPPLAYDLMVYKDNLLVALLPAGATSWSDSDVLVNVTYQYRFEEEYSETATGYQVVPVTIMDVPVPGPTTEVWVSQGGQWVLASETFGSKSGEWKPI